MCFVVTWAGWKKSGRCGRSRLAVTAGIQKIKKPAVRAFLFVQVLELDLFAVLVHVTTGRGASEGGSIRGNQHAIKVEVQLNIGKENSGQRGAQVTGAITSEARIAA